MYTNRRANCPGDALLANALNADANGNFPVAYDFYERGITYYLQVRMVNETNTSIQAFIRQTCHEHLKRAEVLKSFMEMRSTATLQLTDAENAYKQLQYATSYPLYMEGIENLLTSANLIKPSHPHLTDQILSDCGRYMTHAEDVKKRLGPVSPPPFAKAEDVNSKDVLETNGCKVDVGNVVRPDSFRGSMYDVVQCQADIQLDTPPLTTTKKDDHEQGKPSDEELKIRAALYRQRVDALITESHLLLDYLKLDASNEDKLHEIEHVISQINIILEEKNESGVLIVGEHSTDRETLETTLQNCEDFLASPIETKEPEKDQAEVIQRTECLICLDLVAVVATVPCGHKIFCQDCIDDIGDDLDTCYLCKAKLVEPKCIRIYD